MRRKKKNRALSGTVLPPGKIDRPLTPKQLAAYLQISPATLARHRSTLPHIKIGSRTRFVIGDVLQYLKNAK